MTNSNRLMWQMLLLVPLALAFNFGHSFVATSLGWMPDLFSSRPFQLSALLASALLAGLIVAVVFAYPIAALYERCAVAVAWGVALFSAVFRASLIGEISGKPFVLATFGLELLALALCLPISVWVLRRLHPNNSFKPKPLRSSKAPC